MGVTSDTSTGTTLSDLRRGLLAVGRDSSSLFVAITISNLCNYLFHVVISRMIGPAAYGELASVLAVLLVMSVPMGAVQATVAKRVAQLKADAPSSEVARRWGEILRTLVPLGAILSVAVAALSPLLTAFLRLDSSMTSLLLAVYLFPATVTPVLTGALQGRRLYVYMAISSIAGVLARLAFGTALVSAGGGVPGAMAASVFSQFVGAAIALYLLHRSGPLFLKVRTALGPIVAEVRPVVASMAAMWLLIELDLILVRRWLPEAEAGRYAAAGLLARAVLFIPGAIGMVALPRFSASRGRGVEAHRWLTSSIVVITALGSAAALVLAAAPELAISLTFGREFAPATAVLAPLAFAMVAFGVCSLLVLYHVAAGTRIYPILFCAVLVEAGLIAANHESGTGVAYSVAAVAWVVAVIGFLEARSVAISPPPLARLPHDVAVFATAQDDAPADIEISVVLPAYNAGPALAEVVHSLRSSLEKLGRSHEVIIVSDGTTDETDWRHLGSGPVTVVHYPDRQGKGVALRVGMSRARGRYIAFIDSDGDLDPFEIKGFLTVMDAYDPDLVLGSKRHPLSQVNYPTSRRVMSRIYQLLCRILFGLNVRDTQTGMKLIRRDVLDAVLPRLLEKRFAFDLEFLVVAKRLGYTRVFEAPVKLHFAFSSTIAPRAVISVLLDTVAIFYRRYVLLYYDLSPHEEHSARGDDSVRISEAAAVLD